MVVAFHGVRACSIFGDGKHPVVVLQEKITGVKRHRNRRPGEQHRVRFGMIINVAEEVDHDGLLRFTYRKEGLRALVLRFLAHVLPYPSRQEGRRLSLYV